MWYLLAGILEFILICYVIRSEWNGKISRKTMRFIVLIITSIGAGTICIATDAFTKERTTLYGVLFYDFNMLVLLCDGLDVIFSTVKPASKSSGESIGSE
jgi:hypothetical protein